MQFICSHPWISIIGLGTSSVIILLAVHVVFLMVYEKTIDFIEETFRGRPVAEMILGIIGFCVIVVLLGSIAFKFICAIN